MAFRHCESTIVDFEILIYTMTKRYHGKLRLQSVQVFACR